MEPLYEELVRRHHDGRIDFRQVTTFNLDEHVGLGPTDPASYQRYMEERLFRHAGIPRAQSHLLDGIAGDLAAECAAYERKIAEAGGIDLQILGIGASGHIGFNEPTSSLGSRTRIKTLAGDAPSASRHVLTMGVGTILDARKLMLLASGPSKAAAVAKAVEGPLSAMVPASALQLHPDALVLLDEAAAGALTLRSYYDFVYAHKPSWQSHE